MPIMDGYLATQRIRENSDLDNTPIVALSALTSADEINKVFHVGMNGYLAKPFSKEKLYTVFDTFMENKKTVVTKRETLKKDSIQNFDGLNITKGLEQTNGNVIFYIEVLKEFIDAYGQSDLVFEGLIADHRFEQAKMLCLDMRGLLVQLEQTNYKIYLVKFFKELFSKNLTYYLTLLINILRQ